jgi:hypothetical protein
MQMALAKVELVPGLTVGVDLMFVAVDLELAGVDWELAGVDLEQVLCLVVGELMSMLSWELRVEQQVEVLDTC